MEGKAMYKLDSVDAETKDIHNAASSIQHHIRLFDSQNSYDYKVLVDNLEGYINIINDRLKQIQISGEINE